MARQDRQDAVDHILVAHFLNGDQVELLEAVGICSEDAVGQRRLQ